MGSNEPSDLEPPHDDNEHLFSEGSVAVRVEEISSRSLSSQASTPTSVISTQASGEPQIQNSQAGIERTAENIVAQGFPHPHPTPS